MSVFIYSPGIQLFIASREGLIDVSDDIVSGEVQLWENAPSTMSVRLLNKRRKYDKLFTPNDRFVIYMKRIRKLLILTGYLNAVPYFTVWPRTVALTGTGTPKRLQYHWWDPGSLAAFQLMSSTGNDSTATVDSGLSQKAMALLTQVGGWEQNKIHIGAIPPDWLRKVTGLYNAIAPRLAVNWQILGGGTTQGGQSPLDPGSTTTQRVDAPDAGAQLPTAFGRATIIPQGTTFDIQQPTSDYFIQMNFGFTLGGYDIKADKTWLVNRKVLLVNPNNNKSVLCQIVGTGPNPKSGAEIGISQATWDSLSLDSIAPEVQVAWLTADVEQPARLGPFNSTTLNNQNLAITLRHAGENTGTTNPGNPGALVVTQATGATAAVNYCLRQVGKPYASGGGRPINGKDYPAYDCSGLTGNGWFAAGAGDIGDTAAAQMNNPNMQTIPATSLIPGDLLFYGQAGNPHHVVMFVGNGQVVQAPHTGAFVFVSPVDTGGDFCGCKRLENAPAASGNQANLPAQGNGAPTGTASTAQGPQLITLFDWYGQAPDPVSEILSGPRALMNDTPLLPNITTVINASMRSWGQAPNGDFIAWFPDYFGAYGTAGKMQIADVEVQDFTIVWSDEHLVTHQFTAGTWTPDPSSPTPGGPVGYTQMFTTNGVVSVEFPEILQALFNLSPADAVPAKILDRFGARPQFQAMGTILGPVAEFWYALFLFQQNWAGQFTASVPITFMPELYPGMLMQIPSVGFQAYCTQVTHTFDMSDGGGFQTQVNIMAPSAMDGSGLWGLPKGGLQALL